MRIKFWDARLLKVTKLYLRIFSRLILVANSISSWMCVSCVISMADFERSFWLFVLLLKECSLVGRLANLLS